MGCRAVICLKYRLVWASIQIFVPPRTSLKEVINYTTTIVTGIMPRTFKRFAVGEYMKAKRDMAVELAKEKASNYCSPN